jgi:stage III sporulation protein AA
LGCAQKIADNYFGGGLLIAGPPGSGKTTLLRDFIRIMAERKRICVVDTRGELSASYMGECFNDLGNNTDVLLGYPKDKGLFMALRTMFPQIVAFDEFSTLSELKEISQGFLSGVEFALTAHIGSEEELIKRELTKKLLTSGAIKTVALLSGFKNREIIIKSADELVKKCGS